jgi:hypothetical protein
MYDLRDDATARAFRQRFTSVCICGKRKNRLTPLFLRDHENVTDALTNFKMTRSINGLKRIDTNGYTPCTF